MTPYSRHVTDALFMLIVCVAIAVVVGTVLVVVL